MLRIRLLGELSVEADGQAIDPPASRRAWALLGWLALHPGLHPRADVAAAFWPDVLDRSARASMRSALWSLRGALGPTGEALLIATRDRVGLAPDGGAWIDVEVFADHLAAGRREEAVALCRGDLLVGVEDDWAVQARTAHRDRVLDVLAALADGADDPRAAVRWARRAVAVDPFSEDAARRLMACLERAGDRAAAVAVYDRLAERLRSALRVAPSPETSAAARRLRAEDDGAVVGGGAGAAAGGAAGAAGAADGAGALGGAAADGAGTASGAGAVGGAGAHLAARRGTAPLVGRDEELATLLDAWDAARSGLGGVAVVHGDAGLGKSRLAAELLAHAGAHALVAEGGASDLPGPPLAPWADIAAALVRGLGGLPDAPWAPALGHLLPALVTPPPAGPDESPETRGHQVSEAVVALVETAAAARPLVLLLEDAHAADAATVVLVEHLARRIAGLPVLLVVTHRERPRRGDLDTVCDSLRRRGLLAADVGLAPLGAHDVVTLARAAGADDRHAARIAAIADGSPLLAVECARALGQGDADVPAGLRAAARAALATCPEPARELIATLAVAGRDLDGAEAAGRAGVALAAALGPALDSGLLVPRDARLDFRHALLREAVYRDIPAVDRAARHAHAAGTLTGNDRAGEAARHLVAAGRRDAATERLAAAAEHARAVGAVDDAAGLLAEATAIAPDDPGLLLARCDIEAWRHQADLVVATYDHAVAVLERRNDLRGLATAHAGAARWFSAAICWPREALRAATRALAVLDAAGLTEPALRAEVAGVAAWCSAVAGSIDESAQRLQELEALVGPATTDPVHRYGLERTRSLLAFRRGDLDTAIAHSRRATSAGTAVGRPDHVYGSAVNCAAMLVTAGDTAGALAELEAVTDMAHGRGLAIFEAPTLRGRAWILARDGRLDEAREAVSASRRMADRLNAAPLRAQADFERARIDARAGDHEHAAERFALALGVPEPGFSRPLARFLRAESLVRAGRADDAEAELREAILEPVTPGDWPDTLVARLAAVQGLIAAHRGDDDLARRRLEESAATWRSRASAATEGDRWAAALADLGQPLVGLLEPQRELDRVLADLHTMPVRS